MDVIKGKREQAITSTTPAQKVIHERNGDEDSFSATSRPTETHPPCHVPLGLLLQNSKDRPNSATIALSCQPCVAPTHHVSRKQDPSHPRSQPPSLQAKQKSRAGGRARAVRISQEVSTLATSLPVQPDSSIFLRVDEDRFDVMRALITGPKGTPYEGGCFEFDILLPPDYPNKPPHVQFITTGGGRVRFNPNLYNTGKVCLSLLGTWSGPGWNSKTSTLLQVRGMNVVLIGVFLLF